MEATSSPSTAQSRRQLLLKASSQKSKLRPKPNGSSMVVDYYYAVQHPNEADVDETGAEMSRGRACSFGTVLKRDGSSTKKCFVISPIGADESEIRQHANDVFNFIILPALHSRNVDCVRSDMITDLGQITDQMYEAIFQWDLCVAVLTFLNPNVFYELALRHCVGLPVICLIERGQLLPFNVSDMRVIEYTLKPKLLFEGSYAEEVADAVDSLARNHWKCPYPFAKFSPSICSAPTYFSDSHDMESRWSESQWSEFLHQAQDHLDIMGAALRHVKKYEDEIKEVALRKCHVRLLMWDPESPSLKSMTNLIGKQYEAFKLNVDHWYSGLAVLARSSEYITLRKTTRGTTLFSCASTDREVIYQPNFFDLSSFENNPMFYSNDTKSSLYVAVQSDFNLLWELNENADSSLEEVDGSSEKA